jgi:hypothetical protein
VIKGSAAAVVIAANLRELVERVRLNIAPHMVEVAGLSLSFWGSPVPLKKKRYSDPSERRAASCVS